MKNILVAYDKNLAIGNGTDLPWGRDLPSDLTRVKELTLGNTIIMGRKTFESIGRALPGRQNIVVSRTLESQAGLEVARSLDEAYQLAQHDEVFIFGGAQLYEQSIDSVERIYATEVDAEFQDMTTYFPRLDSKKWQAVSRERRKADERNEYAHDFVVYEYTKD